MLDSDVKVIRQVEDARYTADGERQAYIRVEFRVGTQGPFVERFPRDGYTAVQRDNKLNEFAREVRTS